MLTVQDNDHQNQEQRKKLVNEKLKVRQSTFRATTTFLQQILIYGLNSLFKRNMTL